MKHIILTILLIAPAFAAMSQTDEPTNSKEMKTLMGNDAKFGGYLSFTMATANNLEESVFVKAGGTVAAVFNHQLSLGFGGFGYSNDISMAYPDSIGFLSGGYGGMLVEPILFPHLPVHLTFPILFGAGTTTFNETYYGNPGYRNYSRSYENYLFVEPAVNVELSLTKFMRMGISARYMLTSPLSNNEHQDLLRGLNYAFNFKLGWF